jgi:hypothetical protein
MIRKINRYSFVYAISKLMQRILGTTTKNMAGKTKIQVCFHDASLNSLSFVFIINMISDAPKVSDRRLVNIENT